MWSHCCLHCVPTWTWYQGGAAVWLSNRFQSGASFTIVCRQPSFTIEHPAVVWEHVWTEVIRGSLVGPLPPPATEYVQVSPLGLVPKPQSNKWRFIVNLFAPAGASVNDGICLESCSLLYASIDEAVAIIQRLGQGAEIVSKMHIVCSQCTLRTTSCWASSGMVVCMLNVASLFSSGLPP